MNKRIETQVTANLKQKKLTLLILITGNAII